MKRLQIESENLLLVEGKDEVEFLEALFNSLNISNFQIINAGGKDNFKTHILAIKTMEGFANVKVFGIIRDADLNADNAFKSVINSLSAANLDMPVSIGKFSDATLKVGVFIMPGNKKEGMLEHLCLQLIEETEEHNCIENFFECLPVRPDNIAKSKVQAYLSTRKKFVHSLGLAAKKGYWDFKHNKLNELKTFLMNYK